jgi:hypothetical protein
MEAGDHQALGGASGIGVPPARANCTNACTTGTRPRQIRATPITCATVQKGQWSVHLPPGDQQRHEHGKRSGGHREIHRSPDRGG